jgi:hypothetical protein
MNDNSVDARTRKLEPILVLFDLRLWNCVSLYLDYADPGGRAA